MVGGAGAGKVRTAVDVVVPIVVVRGEAVVVDRAEVVTLATVVAGVSALRRARSVCPRHRWRRIETVTVKTGFMFPSTVRD